MSHLAVADVERMIALIAAATDPTVEMPLAQRKQALLEGTAALIGAEMWMWNLSVFHPKRAADIMASQTISGGWQSGREQALALEVLSDPKFNEQIAGPVQEAVAAQRYATFLRNELVSDDRWPIVGAPWRKTGFDHCIVSVYPLDAGIFSGIGFHRRQGNPDFGERERMIVHAIFQQVDWLHRDGTRVPANERVVHLTPRERTVLLLVIGGDSRKLIACKLNLSEHTVGDHLKGIYKKFAVNTRAELQAHFIAGGRK